MDLKISSFKVDITPNLPCNVAGYGSLDRNIEKVFSRLEANGLVWENCEKPLALIQLDTLYVTSELRKIIEERTGVQAVLIASHTHGAPFLDRNKTKLGIYDQEYFEIVADKLVEAIKERSTTQKSEIYCGESQANVAVFRRKKAFGLFARNPFLAYKVALLPNPDISIDQRVTCFFVRDAGGVVTAIFWRFTCHPVTTPGREQISSDYPGAIRTYFRKKLNNENLPVVFLPGPAGDVRPAFTNESGKTELIRRLRFPFQSTFFSYPTKSQYEYFNKSLSDAILDAFDSAKITVSSTPKWSRVSLALKSLSRLSGEDIKYPLGVLSGVGDSIFLFVGAEVSSQYQEIISNRWGRKVFICSYFEDVFGYLPTEDQVDEGGYEGKDFIPLFDLRGDFALGFQNELLKAIKGLISC
ncbi:hypothetical protein [Bdellovibrio sp. BCCA]|uniref:hypothetical protein n=1 Tax=Bdellovibrio sp. BCCA TaxID=3136281 RepID=UPI0030F0D57D